jgi:hypothetical protein
VSSSQVSEIVRQLATSKHVDEIATLATTARLSAEQVQRLRRPVIAQRAARTFSIDHGEFVVDDEVTLPVVVGSEVDIRAVLYLGIRVNLSEPRLAEDLRLLGTRFTLDPARSEDLAYFGFTEVERGVVDALKKGASIAELEAAHPGVAPRTVQAVVYALAACNAVTATGRRTSDSTAPIGKPAAVALAGGDPLSIRFKPSTTAPPTPLPPPRAAEPTRPPTVPPVPARTVTDTSPRLRASTTGAPATAHTTKPPPVARGTTSPPISRTMTPPAVARTTTPPPDRASSPSISRTQTQPPIEPPSVARTPTDPPIPPRTITDPPAIARTTSEDAMKGEAATAQEAFRRGEMALRRDQFTVAIAEFLRAKELGPKEPDYDAMLAWARFCDAIDKKTIAAEVRKALDNASRRSEKPVLAMFYLGRVERMLGRDREALVHFQEVLVYQPGHKEATSEIRVLEARLAGKGLFSRK